MGLKIREAQRVNLGKSIKADQKNGGGGKKSVFQMLGNIFPLLMVMSMMIREKNYLGLFGSHIKKNFLFSTFPKVVQVFPYNDNLTFKFHFSQMST